MSTKKEQDDIAALYARTEKLHQDDVEAYEWIKELHIAIKGAEAEDDQPEVMGIYQMLTKLLEAQDAQDELHKRLDIRVQYLEKQNASLRRKLAWAVKDEPMPEEEAA